ncbi:MAG: hypothetical protein WCW27_00440 [Patescibacteria group bacterium]|jgi:hypothetical protein
MLKLLAMTLKRFVYVITGTTLLSLVAWIVVLFFVDPDISGVVGLIVFYAALLIVLIGLFTLIGLGVRMAWFTIRKQPPIAFKYIARTIRQSIWFSLAIVSSLILSAERLFNWWSSSALLIALLVIEGFFLTRPTGNER